MVSEHVQAKRMTGSYLGGVVDSVWGARATKMVKVTKVASRILKCSALKKWGMCASAAFFVRSL